MPTRLPPKHADSWFDRLAAVAKSLIIQWARIVNKYASPGGVTQPNAVESSRNEAREWERIYGDDNKPGRCSFCINASDRQIDTVTGEEGRL